MIVLAMSAANVMEPVGNAFVVSMLIDEDWFAKHRDYWNKRSMSMRLRRGILFKKLEKQMVNHVVRFDKTAEAIPESIAYMLMSTKNFWEYKVYFDDSITEEMVMESKQFIPKRLHKEFDKTDFKFTPHRSTALVWGMAEEYKYNNYIEIKQIWGDIGTNSVDDKQTMKFIEENCDCPHIKNKWRKR